MDICRQTLCQGLEALQLPLNELQIEQLLKFIKLIEKWNKAYNLTAVRDLREKIGRAHV